MILHYGIASAENCLDTITGKNIVKNGSFEEVGSDAYPVNWGRFTDPAGSVAYIDSLSISGMNSLRVDFDGTQDVNFGTFSQYIDVDPDTTYLLQGYIKTDNLQALWSGVMISVQDARGWTYGLWKTPSFLGTNDWTFVDKEFTTKHDTESVLLYLRRVGGGGLISGSAWWDDIKVLPVRIGAVANSRNIVTNPGFEDSPLVWYLYQSDMTSTDENVFYAGTKSLRIDFGSVDVSYGTGQSIPVEPDTTYLLRAYVKSENYIDNSGLYLMAKIRNAETGSYDVYSTDHVRGDNDWTLLSTEFTTGSKTATVENYLFIHRNIGSGAASGTVWFDEIELLPVPQIEIVTAIADSIEITGKSFGDDPGTGSRSTFENCVLYENECLPESYINSWSDNLIVVNKSGDGSVQVTDGILRVKSGGIVSSAKDIQTDEVLLQNDRIKIEFPDISVGRGIGQITDLVSSKEFLDESVTLPLYELTVKDDPFTDIKTTITSQEASDISYSYTHDNGVQQLVITAQHCMEFEVVATISLPDTGSGGATFSIDVHNNGNRVVQSVRYPLIAARTILGGSANDDAIIIPYAEGYLLKSPGKLNWLERQNNSRGYLYKGRYKDLAHPGPMTMQMISYYDSEAGLYLAMDDTEGYKKRFGFDGITNENGQTEYFLFSFLHITSEGPGTDSGFGGNDLTLNYHVIIDTLSADSNSVVDWYYAADKYKQWVTQAGVPWASKKLSERIDVPDWLYNVQVMIDCYTCPQEDYVPIVNHYESLLGVSNILFYPGGFWGYNDGYQPDFFYIDKNNNQQQTYIDWSGLDFFADNPVYDPSENVNPPFARLADAIEGLRNMGSDVYLFLSSLIWDNYYYKIQSGNPDFDDCRFLDPSTIVPSELMCFDDRNDYFNHYDHKGHTGNFYTLTKENQNEDISLSKKLNGYYCRATSRLCVGTDEDNIMDLAIYNNIRRGIDHGARLMSLDGIVSGGIAGCWNPEHGHPIGEGKWTHDRFKVILSDISDIIASRGLTGEFGLSMEGTQELYLQDLQLQYLRHTYLSPTWMRKAPLFNYVYKEYYLGTEMGQNLKYENDLYRRWSLGIGFTQGNIQSVKVEPDITYVPDEGLLNFYKRILSMKRPDFYKGSMLHPPVFQGVPPETRINRGYIDQILTSVLKTDDTTISYLLVNVNQDGVGGCGENGTDVCNITFDVGAYDEFEGKRAIIRVIKEGLNGREEDLIIDNFSSSLVLPYSVDISLDGGDVVEVRVQVDSDGDGVPDTADCSNGDSTIYPGAVEICDWKDNDCDGEIDEGLDSGHIDLEHAEVEWNNEGGSVHKVKIHGDVYLGCMDYSQLNAEGSVSVDISNVEDVIAESVSFQVKGGEGKKWEYKSGNTNPGINKFKIDWKGAKFDYNENIKIKSEHIGYDASTIEIDRKNVTSSVIISVNDVSVTIDGAGSVTVDPATIEFDVDDDGEIEVELPFTLTQDTVFHVTESNNSYDITVGDYYIAAVGKFKVTGHFDSQNLTGDSNPAYLSIDMGVGEKGFLKSYSISGSDWKELKTKEWKFKLH
jgi:hypothetical protein